ncbi:MAG: hypothetical protein WCX65_14425, partial [bacterium]
KRISNIEQGTAELRREKKAVASNQNLRKRKGGKTVNSRRQTVDGKKKKKNKEAHAKNAPTFRISYSLNHGFQILNGKLG